VTVGANQPGTHARLKAVAFGKWNRKISRAPSFPEALLIKCLFNSGLLEQVS
jgi:hypothetical protein